MVIKCSKRLSSARSVLLLCAISWCSFGHTAEEEAAEHEHEGPNEIAISLGVVHEGGENDGAVGLEYERRFSESFGAGLLVERSWGDHSATIYALPLVRHVDQWKFFLAPGIEDGHDHREELVRIGTGYEIETGITKVTPGVAIDFVGGETVYILSIALGFNF
jgi:hypothetical protein